MSFFITTAIPYANGAPHIGHAYERIATDAIARFKRLEDIETLFTTGMDEHGLKMQQTAIREGLAPIELANRSAKQFQSMGEKLNAVADDVVRTTENRHKIAAQEIWRRLADRGDIYLSKYSGWYSVRDEAYYNDDEVTSNEGQKVGPTGSPVEWTEEESYFFRLSAYQDRLLSHFEDYPDFVTPVGYRNEVLAFIRKGLNDISISRTNFDWGIPVPGDEKHVMYVWIDALANYLTSTGFPATSERSKFWPCDAHVIGKDITRFHAVFWPAFLMSANIDLPKQIVVHGFLNHRGQKIGKSTGNGIDTNILVDEFGVDQIRYFFLREVPFGHDGNYSKELIAKRINSDLANDLGNLVQRSLLMIAKNCDGKVPAPGNMTEQDHIILSKAYLLHHVVQAHMNKYAMHSALTAIWEVVGDANRYFSKQEPWVVGKTDPERRATILYVTSEVLRIIGLLSQSFIPDGAGCLLDFLGVDATERLHSLANIGYALTVGRPLPPPSPIFPVTK